MFAAIRADVRHGGIQAYHAEEADLVRMPPSETLLRNDTRLTFSAAAHAKQAANLQLATLLAIRQIKEAAT